MSIKGPQGDVSPPEENEPMMSPLHPPSPRHQPSQDDVVDMEAVMLPGVEGTVVESDGRMIAFDPLLGFFPKGNARTLLCPECHLPVARYGWLDPCCHLYCLDCAHGFLKSRKPCPKCASNISRVKDVDNRGPDAPLEVFWDHLTGKGFFSQAALRRYRDTTGGGFTSTHNNNQQQGKPQHSQRGGQETRREQRGPPGNPGGGGGGRDRWQGGGSNPPRGRSVDRGPDRSRRPDGPGPQQDRGQDRGRSGGGMRQGGMGQGPHDRAGTDYGYAPSNFNGGGDSAGRYEDRGGGGGQRGRGSRSGGGWQNNDAYGD